MCVCLYVCLCACMYVCLCMPYAMGTCRDQMTTFGSAPFLSKWVPGIELRLSCLAELSLQLNLFSFWKLSVKLVSALLPGRWRGSWRAGSCYRKQHWTQEGNGGEERHSHESQQKKVHIPDRTLVRTGKGIKKTRKKTKALATLHAALMHYIHYLKKTVTKIRHLLGQWFPTSPAQPLWGSGLECTLLNTGLSCLARMTSEDSSTSPA